MKPYEDYEIGDIVEVKRLFKPIRFGSEKSWITRVCGKNAVYVGYTYKHSGKINYDAEEGIRFESEKVFLVARLRFHPRGKERYALFEDIQGGR